MNTLWRILQRYYAARSRRAANAAAYFKGRSEKFYARIKGAMR